MNARTVSVDFNKKCGRIKPLHGLPSGPRVGGAHLPSDLSREFSEIAVPSVRLHNVEYPYGKNQFVDIHCIFPDFTADPELEESYNFSPTDAYLLAVKELGTEISFRLGESSDPFRRKLFAAPPSDIAKYVSVCEHIIMHYNEGWAGGFKLNIRKLEIFGGADDPRVFSGTQTEFFEIYRAISNRIRERFPKIKIGGYGCGGFYGVNRISLDEEQKKYIPFMRDFLRYVTAEETASPLDFFSWYAYPASPEELQIHAGYARSTLDEFGLRRTLSVVCGYNTASFLSSALSEKSSYASELASVLIAMQKGCVDSAYFSDSPLSPSHGISFLGGIRPSDCCPVYHTLAAFGELYRLGTAYETLGDARSEIYTLAASNGSSSAVMVVTRSFSGNLELRTTLGSGSAKIRRIASRDQSSAFVSIASGELPVSAGRVAFRADKDAVYLVEFSEISCE